MKTFIKKTTKEWNDIYFAYIMECIMPAEEMKSSYGIQKNVNTDADRIKFVLDCFDSEVNYENNKRRIPNLEARIADWFMGLPSVISIDFENYKIIELCKKWGVVAPDCDDRVEDKVIDGWYVFMAHYLLKLAKRNKISYSYLY